MDYPELLKVSGDRLEAVKGSYDRLSFGEALDAYQEVAAMYADFLGLDDTAVGVISFLMQSVAVNR